MIDFSKATSLMIPEGSVSQISSDGTVYWSKTKTPYKKRLEYLKSTGTQWIDTGVEVGIFFPSIRIKFNSTTYASCYVGAHNNGSRVAGIKKTSASTVSAVGYDRNVTTVTVDPNAEWNDVFVDRINKTVTADGTTVALNGTFFWYASNLVNLALFGERIYAKDSANTSKAAIAFCEMYNNELELIRRFIPVLDREDRPCMYDEITGGFFYNAGSGEFLYE